MPTRLAYILLALFVGGLFCVAQLRLDKWSYMGDEVRYLYYAVSFFHTGTFHMPEGVWAEYLTKAGYGVTPVAGIGHSVVTSVLLSPWAGLFSVESARWFVLTVGLCGMIGLFKLIRERVGDVLSVVTVTCAMFSLPFFAYAKTLYAETWLFTVAVWAWFLVSRSVSGLGWRLVGLSLALSLPFLHIRAALVSGVLCAVYFWRLRPWKRSATAETGIALLIILLAAGCFYAYQAMLFGSLLGSASATVQPSFAMFADRVAIHLFDLRHGLLTYSPIWIVGLGGLALGCAKRDGWSIQSAFLLVAYLATMVWGNASESMPARFWVAAVPMLSVGFARWAATSKPFASWTVLPVLALITVTNTVLFTVQSGSFLANRTFSVTYNWLFDEFGYMHLGAFLPWDAYGYYAPNMERSMEIAWHLMMALGVVIAALCFACFKARSVVGRLCGAAPLVIVLAVIGRSGAAPILPSEYDLQVSSGAATTSVSIRFKKPEIPAFVRFSEPRQLWGTPAYPAALIMTAISDTVSVSRQFPARPLMPVFGADRVSELRITEAQRTEPALWLGTGAVEVFRNERPTVLLFLVGAFSVLLCASGSWVWRRIGGTPETAPKCLGALLTRAALDEAHAAATPVHPRHGRIPASR
ncbi:MAG: hypothetical protein ACE14M_16510 [Terriglobales bacterium]